MDENNYIKIGGRLDSTAEPTDPKNRHIVAGADAVYDDDLGMKQSELNAEIASIGAAVEGLSPEQTDALSVAEKANSNEAKLGYYECSTGANTPRKDVSSSTYILSNGGSMKIKFINANSYVPTDGNPVLLKIGTADPKPLYYNNAPVNAINTWEEGETVEVYYDPTFNNNNGAFFANNVAGGSGSGDGAFDVSAKYPTSGVEGGNTYTLEGALAVLNANLSDSKKKGGMSIMFIQLIPATYTVVKTEGVTEQPTGTEVQEALSLNSGTYTAAQMTGITPPESGSVTYYLAVTVDETTTYTTWVITKTTNDGWKYVQYRYMETVTNADTFTNVANWQGVDDEPTAGSDNLVKSRGVFDAIVPVTGAVLVETVTTISETPTDTVNFYNDSVIPIKAGNKILVSITDPDGVLKGTGLNYKINGGQTVYNLSFPETIITLEEDLQGLRVYASVLGFNEGVYGDISLNVSVYDRITSLDRKMMQTVGAETDRAQGAEALLQKNLDGAVGYPVSVTGSLTDASIMNMENILIGGKKYRIVFNEWNASNVDSSNATFILFANSTSIGQRNGGTNLSGKYIDVEIPQNAVIILRYRIDSGSFTVYDHSELFKYIDGVKENVQEISDFVQESLQDVAGLKNEVFTHVDAIYKHIFITAAMEIRQDERDGSYIKAVSEDDIVYLKAKNNDSTYALYTLVKSYNLDNNTIELMTGEVERHKYSKTGTIVNVPEDGYIIVTNITQKNTGGDTLDEFRFNDSNIIIKGLKDRVYELENKEDGDDTSEVSAVMFSDNDMFDLESYWKFGKDYLDRLYAEKEINVINAFISKFKARAGEGKYQIAVISDTHGSGAYTYYSNSNLQFITCMRSIAAFNAIVDFCDAGIHGGDISCDYGTSRRRQLGYMRTLIRQFRFDKPFFITKGNHDENNNSYIEADLSHIDWNNHYYVRRFSKFTQVTKETWTGDDLYTANREYVSDKEFSNYVQHWLAPSSAVWGNGAYYYYDVDAVKMRVVVGNSFPVNNDYEVSNREEYLWLAQEAFDFSDKGADKSNWKVLMLRHTQGTNLAEEVGGQSVQLLANCINALRNGTTWSYDGYEFDFGEINGGGIDFIAHIHGHEHKYCFSNGAGYFDIGETSAFTNKLGDATKYGISVWTIDIANSKVYEDTISGNSWVYNYDSGRLELKRGGSFRCAKSGLSGTVVVSCTEPTITIEGDVVTIGDNTPLGNYTVSVSDGTTTFSYLITVVDGQDDEVVPTEWVTPLSSFATRDVDNLENYYTKGQVDSTLSSKYTKPSSGIPSTDIAPGVIPDVSNFITASVNNLTNYYLKSETYTKAEVAALLAEFTNRIATLETLLAGQTPESPHEQQGTGWVFGDTLPATLSGSENEE